MKKFRRIISGALALVMCAGLASLAGCGDGGGKGDGEKVVDLEGYKFTISSPWLYNETEGEALATYEKMFQKRRREVERDYNCTIEIMKTSNFGAQILAGEKVADWIDQTTYNTLSYAMSDYLVPYEEIEGINLSDEKWTASVTELFAMDGKHYAISPMIPPTVRNVICVNKTMLKECGIEEDIHELVKNKQWTFDKFREMCQKCTNAEKGTYGFIPYDVYEFFAGFIAANGGKIADIKDGKVVETTTSKNVINALNFIDSLANEYKVIAIDDKQRAAATFGSYTINQAQISQKFINNKIAFYYLDTWVLNQLVVPLEPEIEFTIVPMPIGPDATDYTSSAFGLAAFSVTNTNKDLDKAVVVMNALGERAEGYEDDEWIDEAIITDYLQPGDEGGLEAYKISAANPSYDFVRTEGTNDLWGEFVVQCGLNPIYFRTTSVSSGLQSFEGLPTARLNSLMGIE